METIIIEKEKPKAKPSMIKYIEREAVKLVFQEVIYIVLLMGFLLLVSFYHSLENIIGLIVVSVLFATRSGFDLIQHYKLKNKYSNF